MTNGASVRLYIGAVIGMAVLAVGSILLLTILRPNQDNTGTFALLLATIAPTTAALLSFLKGSEAAQKAALAVEKTEDNSQAIKAVEVKIDGRLTQLLEQTGRAKALEGREKGRAEEVAARVAGDVASASAGELAAVVAKTTAAEVTVRVDEAVNRIADTLMARLTPQTTATGDETTAAAVLPIGTSKLAEHVATEAVRPMKEQIQETVAPLLEGKARPPKPPEL